MEKYDSLKSLTNKKRVILSIISISIVSTFVLILLLVTHGQTHYLESSNSHSENNTEESLAPYSYATSSFSGLGFESFEDLMGPLYDIGLAFINTVANSQTQGQINIDSLHISRVSESKPIEISSKTDIDILLEVMRLAYIKRLAGVSWEPYIDEAILEAGLEDYLWRGINEITRYSRQRQIIEFAEKFTKDELVAMYLLPWMLDEFQALGFFLDWDD